MGSEETMAPQSHYPHEVLEKQLIYAQETIRLLNSMIYTREKRPDIIKKMVKKSLESPYGMTKTEVKRETEKLREQLIRESKRKESQKSKSKNNYSNFPTGNGLSD